MFAGGECSSRRLQILLNPDCDRVRGTKHATTYPFRVFERRHGLADIVERGAVVFGERDRRNPSTPKPTLQTASGASPDGRRRLWIFGAMFLIREGRCLETDTSLL